MGEKIERMWARVGYNLYLTQGGGVPSGATSGGVGGSVTSASLLKLQQQQQQQTAVPLQQQQPSTNAPQPPFNQVNKLMLENILNFVDLFFLRYKGELYVLQWKENDQVFSYRYCIINKR